LAGETRAAGLEHALGDLLRVQRLARLAQDVDRDLLRRLSLGGCLLCHGAGLLLLVGVGRRCGEEESLPPNISSIPPRGGAVPACVTSRFALGPVPERSSGRAVDAAHRLA